MKYLTHVVKSSTTTSTNGVFDLFKREHSCVARGGRRGHDRIVVGFITTYAISGFLWVLQFPPSIKLTVMI